MEQCLGLKPLPKSFLTQKSEITQAGFSLLAALRLASYPHSIPHREGPWRSKSLSVGEVVPIVQQYEARSPRTALPSATRSFSYVSVSVAAAATIYLISCPVQKSTNHTCFFHWLWICVYLAKLFHLKARGISWKLKNNNKPKTSNNNKVKTNVDTCSYLA